MDESQFVRLSQKGIIVDYRPLYQSALALVKTWVDENEGV